MPTAPPLIVYVSPGHRRAIDADWRGETFFSDCIADIFLIPSGVAVSPHPDVWPYGRPDHPEFSAIFADLPTALGTIRRDRTRLWDVFLGLSVSRETHTTEIPA